MFGIGKLVDNFISDPLGTTVDIVSQPLVDAVDVFNGMTEGEIRERAALRLGADVVAGMALSEVISALMDE